MTEPYLLPNLLSDIDRWKRQLPSGMHRVMWEVLLRLDGIREAIRQFEVPTEENREDNFNIIGDFLAELANLFSEVPVVRDLIWALYQVRCRQQKAYGSPLHKGRDLFNIGSILWRHGEADQGIRLISLAMVEDMLYWKPDEIKQPRTAYRFLCDWVYGQELTDKILEHLESRIKDLRDSQVQIWYPEQVFDLGGLANTEVFPSSQDNVGFSPIAYEDFLAPVKEGGGGKDGKPLERLFRYLISTVPDVRVIAAHRRGQTCEYDLICRTLDNSRLERTLGQYLVIECKEWDKSAGVQVIREFLTRLLSSRVTTGILASKKGISGEDDGRNAHMEIINAYQRHGVAILVLDLGDLESLLLDGRIVDKMLSKYESLRFGLPERNDAKPVTTRGSIPRRRRTTARPS